MVATFGDMQTRISDDLGRNDLLTSTLNGTVSPIANAIQSAIKHYESERFWFNEARATASTTAPVASVGTPNYALPTDCIEFDSLSLTVNGTRYALEQAPWSDIDELVGITAGFGAPNLYALYADQIWLYPVPDAVYTLTLSYLKSLSALSANSDTNAWVVEAEALIRTRAKVLLMLEVTKDPEGAAGLEALEQDLLTRLRSRTGRIVGTGHVRPTEF
jgi:hypothetical protein